MTVAKMKMKIINVGNKYKYQFCGFLNFFFSILFRWTTKQKSLKKIQNYDAIFYNLHGFFMQQHYFLFFIRLVCFFLFL